MKVLIPVDPSTHSQDAFDWYVKNLYQPDHQLYVLHIRDPPKLPTFSFTEGGAFPADEISKIMVEANKKTEELKDKYTMKCGEKKLKAEVTVELNKGGNAGQYVVESANKHQVDMIIMGSRGLGTIRRTILGSVSDYVIHHTKIPVLVCPK